MMELQTSLSKNLKLDNNLPIQEYLVAWRQLDISEVKAGRLPSLLGKLATGKCPPEVVEDIVMARYCVAHFFEDFLKHAMQVCEQSNPRPEPLLQAIRANLADETGLAGYGEEPHSIGRKHLIEALNGRYYKEAYDDWVATLGTYNNLGNGILPVARQTIESVKAQISRGPLWAGATLLSYEHRISRGGEGDYVHLLKGLENTYPQLRRTNYNHCDALWHIYSHSLHDERHTIEFIAGLAGSASTLGDWTAALNKTMQIWDDFWCKMEECL